MAMTTVHGLAIDIIYYPYPYPEYKWLIMLDTHGFESFNLTHQTRNRTGLQHHILNEDLS